MCHGGELLPSTEGCLQSQENVPPPHFCLFDVFCYKNMLSGYIPYYMYRKQREGHEAP